MSSPARARLLAGLTCAALLAATERPASALSCGPPPWVPDFPRGSVHAGLPVPVDAVLWEARDCAYGLDEPVGCRLEHAEETLALTVEVTGRERCSLDPDEYTGDEWPQAIVYYTPDRPLTPGRSYWLRCDEHGPVSYRDVVDVPLVSARDSAEPSAPPSSLAGARVESVRGDDSCCGRDEWIELTVDRGAAHFTEGGHVEVVYADGQVHALGLDGEEAFALPPTEGAIALTPVAANGARGETIEFGDIPEDLVYVACTLGRRTSPLTLWLLAPLAWIGARRRRRGGGGAS